jgi:ABC-type nickel/cobalt efflux system permease component RcnA
MLNFIVLGIVPGTSIQLTFSDVIMLLAAMGLVLLCAYYASYRYRQRIIRQYMLSLMAL